MTFLVFSGLLQSCKNLLHTFMVGHCETWTEIISFVTLLVNYVHDWLNHIDTSVGHLQPLIKALSHLSLPLHV